MPAHAAFTVNDRAASPVGHVFSPTNIDANGVAVWKESNGVPVGEAIATLSNKTAGTKFRVTETFKVPVVQTQTINGISSPVVVRTGYAKVEFTFDPTSTLQERKDLVSFVYNSLASAQTMIDGVVTGLGNIY